MADAPPRPDLSPIRDPRIMEFAELWLRLRGGRPVPARRDLDPLDFPHLLSRIWIADVVAGPAGPRYRYRLAGEDVNAAYPYALKGRYIDDVLGPARYAVVGPRYDAVCARPGLNHAVGRIYQIEDRTYPGERLVLPLAEDGRTPDALVSVVIYDFLGGGSTAPPTETPTLIPSTAARRSRAPEEGARQRRAPRDSSVSRFWL